MLHIEFKTRNAAFSEGAAGAECARILRDIACTIEGTARGSGHIADINGNLIGYWSLSVEAEQDYRD